MLREVHIDLTKLDAESTYLDLRVNAACTLNTPIWASAAQITRPIDAISWSLVKLSPRLCEVTRGDLLFVFLLPLGWVNKPVRNELASVELGGLFVISKVPFCKAPGSQEQLALLTDFAELGPVFAVDNQELNMEHSLANRNDIGQLVQIFWSLRLAGNLEEGDGTLCFSRAIQVDHRRVRRKIAQLPAIFLGQEIADEESVSKGRKLRACTTNQNLTHGGCQMCHCYFMLFHPLCETLVTYHFCWRNDDLRAQEEGCENVSLRLVRISLSLTREGIT
jgi:hypothetical protein